MKQGRYFYDDGRSRKFWSYRQRAKTVTICYGRIGTEGRESKKLYKTPSAAEEDVEKQIDQKVRKGYLAIDPSKLKITRAKGKRRATELQITKLEGQIGSKLPAEYRAFLLEQNGGEPDPFFIGVNGHPHIKNVGVGYILGLHSKAEPYQSLRYAVEHRLPVLPNGQLPIAGAGDIISISLSKNPGRIYLWDHEALDCSDEDEEGKASFKMSHGYLLAGSFDEFLTRIAAFTDEG